MIHLTFPSSETAWPHLVNTFWWFVSSEQRVLQRWAVLPFKISEPLCSHKHKLAKVCLWRHFPLNHSDCSNPCRPQLATTTTFPCGLSRMWFKSLRCDCDFPHNIEEFPRRDKQGKYPQTLQLLHHWFRFSKPIGKRCRFCHATEEGAHMHNQPVVTVREPFSPLFPTLQKVRSTSSVSSAMLKAEKTWAWQTPQTLCWEEP